jgi:hypothetical protein
MYKEFLAILLNSLCAQVSDVGLNAVIWQDDYFFRGNFSCSARQTSGVVNVMNHIDGFLLWKILNKYASFSIPKESLHILMR